MPFSSYWIGTVIVDKRGGEEKSGEARLGMETGACVQEYITTWKDESGVRWVVGIS